MLVQDPGTRGMALLGAGLVGGIVGSLGILRTGRTVDRDRQRLETVLQGMSSGTGDLTVRLPLTPPGSLDRSFSLFNTFLDRVNQLIWVTVTASQTLGRASDRLSTALTDVAVTAQQVNDAVSQSAAGNEDQANAVSRSAAAVENLSQSAGTVSQSTRNAADATVLAASLAASGLKDMQDVQATIQTIHVSVHETALIIGHLGDLGDRIGAIVSMISGIAAQTNLLALNAAIEAARAGESGRGFAVVADEVRKLAAESARSSEEITGLVQEIQARTQTAVQQTQQGTADVAAGADLVRKCASAFDGIVQAAESASTEVASITEAVAGLADGLRQMSHDMEMMAAASEQISAAAQQAASSAEEQSTSTDEIARMSGVVASMSRDMAKLVQGYHTQAAVWGDTFITEILQVDEQHRSLFDAINRFGDAIQQGHGVEAVDQTLKFLLSYTEEHFRDEEALMAKHGYPDLAMHRTIHETFERKVATLIEQNQQGDVRAVFLASQMLTEWLQKHILEIDLKGYVPYVRERMAR
jgi:methyl-accepting chemotaxis protein